MKKPAPMKVFRLSLPDVLRKRVDKEARRTGESVASVIRLAVAIYVSRKEQADG